MSKIHRWLKLKIRVDDREITLLERRFQLLKVEKQAEIQPVHTDIRE